MSVVLRRRDLNRRSLPDAVSACADGLRSAAARGSKRRGRSRSSLPTASRGERFARELMDNAVTNWRFGRLGRLRLPQAGIAVLALVLAALALAACTASPPAIEPQASLPPAAKPAETSDMTPAALREHQRILAAYGGVYNDPRLQS